MSYLFFRMIMCAAEVKRKRLKDPGFLNYFYYVFFPPTFVAGPVEPPMRFFKQLDTIGKLTQKDLNLGLTRLLLGIIKKFFIADQISPYVFALFDRPETTPIYLLWAGTYGLLVYLYLDFSGYSDMAIGLARLLGVKLGENFKNPLFKTNLAKFWRSWHISMHNFIRDYFYFPFFKQRIFLGLVITMVVFHLWHEISGAFLILGLYHGVGMVICQACTQYLDNFEMMRKRHSFFLFKACTWFCTLTYVAWGLLFFFFNFTQAFSIFKRMIKIVG